MDFSGWSFRRNPKENTNALAELELPGFVRDILVSRGFDRPEAARAFLEGAGSLNDPFLLADMDKAAARVLAATEAGESILVFGDYDCDGIAATVMLYDYLENLGADVSYYIPEREGEGYGLGVDALRRIHQAGITLVVTVDNGISAVAEVEEARKLGIEIVVTDHHRPGETLPEAVAVVDPHRADCAYPYKDICGAGVAFKLMAAIEQCGRAGGDAQDELLEQYGDLLAVATLADVVPLTGENRIIVRRGLNVLAESPRVGLAALAEAAGLDLTTCSGDSVAFGIAPRINVCGRIGSVDTAVTLLLSDDRQQADALARELNELNIKRRSIDEEILSEAHAMIAADPLMAAQRVLILCGERWNLGVIGITASRIVERYHKPCIIISSCGEATRGSARSVEGFSIIEAIASCGDILIKYGGHPMAAGLSIEPDKLDEFKTRIQAFAAAHFPKMPAHTLGVDTLLSLRDITLESVQEMGKLAPFGCTNPAPVFALLSCRVDSVSPMGNGNHIKLTLNQNGTAGYPVMFGVKPECFPVEIGETVDCAVSLCISEYNGQKRVNVRINSVRPSGFDMRGKLAGLAVHDAFLRGEAAALPTFTRGDLSVVYRFLREHSPYPKGRDMLFHRLRDTLGENAYLKVLFALDILRELSLVIIENETITVTPAAEKTDITQSRTFVRITERKG